MKERVQWAAFLLLNDPERAEEKASFLLKSIESPDFSDIQSEFLTAVKNIFEKGSAPHQKEFGETLLKALVYKYLKTPKSPESPLIEIYCLDNSLRYGSNKVWRECMASLFLSVAQDEHFSLSPKERAEGALKSLQSEVFEIRSRSISFLFSFVEDPTSLVFEDRVRIAMKMNSYASDERSRMKGCFFSLLKEFNKPWLEKTEGEVAEILLHPYGYGSDREENKAVCGLLLFKSMHPETPKKDAAKALAKVIYAGTEDQKFEACTLLERFHADQAFDFDERIKILLRIALHGMVPKTKKKGRPLPYCNMLKMRKWIPISVWKF